MIAETDAPLLKQWLLNKAKGLSDAEPDVLVDYILALLNNRVEGEELVKLLTSELSDFVKDSKLFAKEVVECLDKRSFDTGEISLPSWQQEKKQTLELTNSYKPDFTTYLAAPSDKRKSHKDQVPVKLPSGVAAKPSQKTNKQTLLSVVSTEEEKTNKLIIANIPEDKLEEPILRSYFQRFGDIEKVEIFVGSRSAELEFVDHKSATKAWASPAPIFDNRFIKVFFKKLAAPEEGKVGVPANEEESFDIETFKLRQEAEQQKWQEQQEKELKYKENLRKVIELKEKMLVNYERELTILENQLRENPELEDEIKAKYERIEQAINMNGATPILIAQDRAKLEGTSNYSSRASVPRRGRGKVRGGIAQSPYARPTGSNKVDFRTKTVIVKDFQNPESEQFKKYIDIVKPSVEEMTVKSNDLVISFRNRSTAEKFMKMKLQLETNGPLLKVEWDESKKAATANTDNEGDVVV